MAPDWHALLSGERRGAAPTMLRALLTLATPAYSVAVRLRNLAFDRGWKRTERLDVPIVSIGNLTTGGAGKTPLVAWTIARLERLGARPGIISRGYGGRRGEPNDERLMLDLVCPGTPHVQNPDRVAAAREAIARHGCDILVLDDGFQHRRLERDLDVVLIDCLNPWGYGALLPRGLMREPRSGLGRADLVCLTRVDQIDAARLAALRDEVRRWTPAAIIEAAFVPRDLVNAAGERAPLSRLHSAVTGACCGIGNPEAFRRTLAAAGASPTAERFRAWPDHHRYSDADRRELAEWVNARGIDLLAVTQKDLVKLPQRTIGRAELWAVEMAVEFYRGESEIESRLRELAARSAGAPTTD
jgi:tetraacyldisaccharide 4'-kinase